MNIKKIRPLYTGLLVTKDVYSAKTGELATKANGTVREIQKVIAVGNSIREDIVKAGDYVYIDPKKYAVYKYEENSARADLLQNKIIGYDIPQVTIEGKNYLLLDISDVKYVIEEYEDDPISNLITRSTDIIR